MQSSTSPSRPTFAPPTLELRDFACIRDNRCLFSGLNVTIQSGDIVHLEGPNGTGKTTLLRALIGLMPETLGDILWQGQAITDQYHDFHSQLLFIGHLTGIKKSLTPRENLQFLTKINGNTCSSESIDEALESVGLYGYEDMPGYQLSAGQQRRVALARLYLTQAAVWILDEPYTALDVAVIDKLERLFEQHAEQGGCVLLTSHQAPQISQLRRLSLSDYLPSKAAYNALTGESATAGEEI